MPPAGLTAAPGSARADLSGQRLRDRLLLLTAIAFITGISWLYLVRLAADMDSHMPMGMASAAMQRSWTLMDSWLMFLMWAVMMVAMMLPSAVAMLLFYDRLARQKMSHPRLAVTLFASGYLLVWTGFSAGATTIQWALRETGLINDMMVSSSGLLSGALLMAAGLYQLSDFKQNCLHHCQAPFPFVMQHWRAGLSGALVMGLYHGAFCLGCCWLLMALLFVGGVMNLGWIALLALFVLAEKLLPNIWFVRSSAVLLLVSGALLACFGTPFVS